MPQHIYLDHAATTPMAEEVLAAMLPYFRQEPGNAHSRSHSFGWTAAQAVQRAREQLAELLACEADELTFTSGSTEAIHLAIRGVAQRYSSRGRHIITTQTEHSAVLSTCEQLEKEGYTITYLSPEPSGTVDPQVLAKALRPDTILVAMLWANNETGVIQNMAAMGSVCRAHETPLFADATQIVGKLTCHPKEAGVSLLACSAHKFYGPKGVGALYISGGNPRVPIVAQNSGGGQEKGLRGGTLNVPGIVGMGAAAVLAKAEMKEQSFRLKTLRDGLEASLKATLPAVLINGAQGERLPHISNISFRFVDAEALLSSLHRRLAVSTGSACSSVNLEPSHVLLAMGLSPEDARSAIRISLGRDTTTAELQAAASLLVKSVVKLRGESPAWELHQDGLL